MYQELVSIIQALVRLLAGEFKLWAVLCYPDERGSCAGKHECRPATILEVREWAKAGLAPALFVTRPDVELSMELLDSYLDQGINDLSPYGIWALTYFYRTGRPETFIGEAIMGLENSSKKADTGVDALAEALSQMLGGVKVTILNPDGNDILPFSKRVM